MLNPQSAVRKKVVRRLASLKLAVFVIIAISCVVAVGTIVESKYDAAAAKRLVYHTWWMYAVLGLLATNLIAVMVDRLPWKKRHLPFILAHIGILFLLGGGLVTDRFGLDGSMRIGINDANRFVTIDQTEINLFASFDGQQFTSLLDNKDGSKNPVKDVNFYRNRPTEQNPFLVMNLDEPLTIVDFQEYVAPQQVVVEGNETDGAIGSGVRFQLFNSRANEIAWLVQRRPNEVKSKPFGPAFIHIGPVPEIPQGINEAYLSPQPDGKLVFTVFKKDHFKPFKTEVVEEGSVVDIGWMDLKLRVLRFYPKAREEWDVEIKPYPTPLTTAAVKLRFRGKDHWVLLNDIIKLFSKDTAYIFTFVNKRVDLKYPVRLKKFEMDKYPGTARAMTYKSLVEIPELGEREISMNEPLKYGGLTFYQASFQEDEAGQPTASILSVNHDPGRPWKYLGSLIMSIGIIMMFWFKRFGQQKSVPSGRGPQGS